MSINQSPKLLDEVKAVIRLRRYALSTERNYCSWIIQFVKYHKLSNKATLLVDAEKKIESFLTYLAVEKGVAPATQNQAMNALIFLYKHVLE